jgi:hypothetical protein
MNQDEVDLIYEYLHENYEYCDGELIAINARSGVPVGKKLGCFVATKENRASFFCQISVKGKIYRTYLQFLIYIFHHKNKPKYIKFLDSNPVNFKIENLEKCSGLVKLKSKIMKNNKTGVSGIIFARKKFNVRIHSNKKLINCGNYNNLEEAKKVKEICEEIIKKYPETNSKEIKEKIGYVAPTRKKGVKKGFVSKIVFNKKRIYLGYYKTKEEAHQAYLKAKEEYKNQKHN